MGFPDHLFGSDDSDGRTQPHDDPDEGFRDAPPTPADDTGEPARGDGWGDSGSGWGGDTDGADAGDDVAGFGDDSGF